MIQLPEYVDCLPNSCGAEGEIERAVESARGRPLFLPDSPIENGRVMMNEFPPKCRLVMREASDSETPYSVGPKTS